jgi:nucleotide-binding universal stress UspA family protein
MRILAATDFSTRAQRALRRAGLLAKSNNATLTLVHVVDNDQPSEIIDLEKREAQRYLAEQLNTVTELQGVPCEAEVVDGDPFDGILRAADARSVDLIVMGAHRKQILRDIFIGTTIERVIRTGPYPVLMVNADSGSTYQKVMAAVDMSEPSARAIRVASDLGLTGNTSLTLVHGFDPVAKGKMANAGIGSGEIGNYVAQERLQAGRELVAFLEANNFGVDNWSLRIKEAGAVEAILDTAGEIESDLLVIGTHGRSGFVKALLGSVTETILRSADVDVLAVPPIGK